MVLVAPTQRSRTLVCLAPEQNIRVPSLVMRMLRVRALVPIDNSLTATSTPTCRVDHTSTLTCCVDHASNTTRMGLKRGAKHETTLSYTETVRACALAQCSSTSAHACMNTDQSITVRAYSAYPSSFRSRGDPTHPPPHLPQDASATRCRGVAVACGPADWRVSPSPWRQLAQQLHQVEAGQEASALGKRAAPSNNPQLVLEGRACTWLNWSTMPQTI